MRRSGARRVPFAVLLLGVLAGGMCALLALNTATAASEVRERRLDAANTTLNATQEQLSRAISGLQAPGQLARMAAALGMVPAGSPAYLRVNANGTVTVLGHPAKIVAPPKALTPAQKAAQQLAAKAAATTKAAQAKAAHAKAARLKAAQAKPKINKAKPAKGTTPASATSTGASPSTSPTGTAPSTGRTSPTKTSPTKTSPTKTSPTKTSPTKTSPTKTSPTKTKTPTATITISGGPR